MKKKLISILKADIYKYCLTKTSLYREVRTINDIEKYRLSKFNLIWKDAYENVPFYKEYKNRNILPNQIKTLNELDDWPIITKKNFQENSSKLLRKSPPNSWISTGGSTGEPLKLGSFNNGTSVSGNQWIGRASCGITPDMKCLLIWGHQHLYGKGFKRFINITKRRFFDFLLNYNRLSGYDLSNEVLNDHFNKFLKYSPDYIISFSASLLAFCRANNSKKEQIKNNNLKGVICTAGPLTVSEKNEISFFFNCPVIMEYGSVECGVMAYSSTESYSYNVFWDTHLLDLEIDDYGYNKNIVTRLTKEYVPIIRYDIGDYLEIFNEDTKRPIKISDVIGRPSDLIEMPGGIKIYSTLINDCVKQIQKVKAVQTIVNSESLDIHVICTEGLDESDKNLIIKRINIVAPKLANIKLNIQRKEELIKTKGGKFPSVIYNKKE